MKNFKILGMIALVLLVGLTSCGPKDETIQKGVNALLSSGMAASVTDGVVTLSGEVENMELVTSKLENIMEVKGVKSIENNCTVAVPAVPEIIIPEVNSELKSMVTDALKDFPGVEYALNEGQVALSGEISKAKLLPLMQILQGMGLKVNSTNLVKK